MSTVLIVVIVVVVVLIVAGLLLTRLPKARERARLQARERELGERRDQVVDEHRQEAASRGRQAEVAEQRARVAAQEAERERAESQLAEEKAKLHERGLADHELIDDRERQRFAGTSATEPVLDDAASTSRVGSVPRTAETEPGAAGSRYDETNDAGAQDPSRVEDLEAGRRRE
jgi:FtsZ-interacting cell division protein ZipA